MFKYKITYQPFTTSDLTSSDVVVRGKDEEDARAVFERLMPGVVFVSAVKE